MTAQRLRNSEIAVFCAFVLFALAWLPLQGIRDPLPIWENAVRPHPEIRAAFTVVQIAGFVAFLAIVAGGLPYLALVAMRALRARRRDVLLLLALPFLSMALLVGYCVLASPVWIQRQATAPNAPFTPLAVALQLCLVVIVGFAIAGSTIAIAVAVARGEPDERIVRYAYIPAIVTACAMASGFVGALILSMLTLVEAPPLRSFGDVPVILLMGGAAALAGLALRRGRHARAV
jgi:MFS family permease